MGIIPAHAGNTIYTHNPWFPVRDHPRACGEHTLEPFRVSSDPGSSPRMRGTLEQGYRGLHLVGIIPAHAGNTITRQPAQRAERDHPRACGEHQSTSRIAESFPGSSPRMRGTPTGTTRVRHRLGIIPAHAGNTCTTPERASSAEDHPRACGEHSKHVSYFRFCGGSSPRMRGTPFAPLHDGTIPGIIPAHAGNTTQRTILLTAIRDHPRACGEHNTDTIGVCVI